MTVETAVLKNILLGSAATVMLSASLPTVAAAEITQDEATLITKSVQEGLANLIGDADDSGYSLSWEGETTSSIVGDKVVTKLPKLKWMDSYTEDFTKIDEITLEISEKEDGLYPVTITFPKEVSSYSSDNRLEFMTVLSKQDIKLEWSEKHQSPIKVDAKIEDVNFFDVEKGDSLPIGSISEIRQTSDLSENSKGTFDGPSDFTLLDASMFVDDMTFTVGRIVVDTFVQDLDFEAYNKLQQRGSELSEATAEPEVQDIKELFELLFSFVDTSKSTVLIKDVQLSEKGTENNLEFSEISFGGNMSGMKSENMGLHVQSGFKGFKFFAEELSDSPMLDLANISTFNLDLELASIPTDDTKDVLFSFLDEIAAGNDDAQTAKRFYENLTSIFQANDSAILLNGFTLENDMVALNGDGELNFDPNAVTGIVGTITFTAEGFDTVSAKLQEIAADENASQREKESAFGAMMGVGMAQSFGKAEGNRYVYQLDFTPEGTILLNGADIGGMIGQIR